MTIEITALNIYPVKSLHGIELNVGSLGVRGLAYDRNWVITDESGTFVSQRELPSMATIRVSLTADALILAHHSTPPLQIDLLAPHRHAAMVTVWRDHCRAFDEGADASRWLTEILGTCRNSPLFLRRFDDSFTRQVDVNYLRGEESHTAFADGFPYLITSEESLNLLNEKLVANGAARVPMSRFRPNIVIRGAGPFAEDSFSSLREVTGRYEFGIRKPCKRCPITTIDQETGIKPNPKEPLRTLAQLNTQPALQGAYFGQNATLLVGDQLDIAVGDQLILSR